MRPRKFVFLFNVIFPISVLGAHCHEGVELNDTSHLQLQELEVSAKKQNSSLSSTSPTQNLDSRQFLAGGITDIGDAMRRLAGISLRDYGGAGGMKTLSVRGLGAQHTGVIYDGAAVSDMQSGQIDLSRYSLKNFNSLTLNIGDNDDLSSFGRSLSNASSLNITSISPQDIYSVLPSLSASFCLASFSTFNPFIYFAKGNGKNMIFNISADFLHSRNDYPFKIYNGSTVTNEHRENSQVNRGNFEGNFLLNFNEKHTVRLKGYYYNNYRHLPGPVIYYAAASNERLHEINSFGQIDYSGIFSSKVSFKGLAKFNWSLTKYKDENGRYPGGKLDNSYIQNEEYGAANVFYKPFENLNFSFSSDYFHNHLTNTKGRSPSRDTFIETISAKYNIWRLNILAHVLLTMVEDYTDNDSNRFTARVSPSFSMSVRPLENTLWNIRLSYKNIFRMPSFNELYFDNYGSVNLNPELTDQFNFGMTWSSDFLCFKYIEITADGFLNYIRNKIVALPYNMFIWTMSNIGKVRSTGFDLTLNGEIAMKQSHSILFSGNYSYQRVVSRTNSKFPDWNKQLPYTPVNSGAFSLTWLNPWVNVVIHASGCSSRYSTSINSSDTRMPGYMEFGAAVFREFKIRNTYFNVRADIINAFDKQYEIVRRYPMPGRAYSFTLEFHLNKH